MRLLVSRSPDPRQLRLPFPVDIEWIVVTKVETDNGHRFNTYLPFETRHEPRYPALRLIEGARP
jgi:hypothetical protein